MTHLKDGDEKLAVKFLEPIRKMGICRPTRDDIQNVNKEFILKSKFVPECQNSGRLENFKSVQKSVNCMRDREVFTLIECSMHYMFLTCKTLTRRDYSTDK